MSGYAQGLLTVLSINIILAYGAFLPMAAGQLNFGIAAFAAIGAYVSAVLSNNGLSPLVAIPMAAAAAGLVGMVISVPILRTRGIYLALATFAFGQIVVATLLNLDFVGGAAGYPVTGYLSSVAIWIVAVIVVALVWLLFATRFGISITAVHDDERVADLMGLNTWALQIAAFSIGSAVAGVGGALYAHHFSFIEAQYFGVGLSSSLVLYAIFGGTQTVVGPLIGATVFTLLPELLRATSQWRYILFASVIIVMMTLRPQGLVSSAQLRRLLGGGGRV